MGKPNKFMCECASRAIATAKATRRPVDILAAVIAVKNATGWGYTRAAETVRVKSGLDTPTLEEAKAMKERGMYLAGYTTPVKDYKPILLPDNTPKDKKPQAMNVTITRLTAEDLEF
jgi:hypothetical protein